MPGADIRRFSGDRRGQAPSLVAGVAGGALLALAETLLHPAIVLALFVSAFTGNPAVVGLVPAVGAGLRFPAQALAERMLRGTRRRQPWAVGAAVVRVAAIALLAYVVSRAERQSDAQVLRSFFICYGAYALAAGFGAAAGNDAAVRAVAPARRGLLFAGRDLWGSILAFLGALVAVEVFDAGLAFPGEWTRLMAAAAVAIGGAALAQVVLREPRRAVGGRPARSAAARAAPLAPLADGAFRRFLAFRTLLAAAALADPFFVLYAVRELGVELGFVGVYLAAYVGGRIVAAPWWAAVERRRGARSVLQGAALLRLLGPLVAVTLPYLAETSLWEERFGDGRALGWAFAAVFVALGAALGGAARGTFAHLLALAPPARREGYASLTGAVLAVAAAAPVLGGLLLERTDYERVFLGAALLALASVFASGALAETGARTRAAAGARRLGAVGTAGAAVGRVVPVARGPETGR